MFNHVATARMRSAPSDHGHGFDGGGFDGGGFDGGGLGGIGFGGLLADASGPGAHGFEVQGPVVQGFGAQDWAAVQDGHAQGLQSETAAAVAIPQDAVPGDPQAGPMSSGHAQGQCFSDVVNGVLRALDPEYFTGHVLTGMIRGISPQVMIAELGTHATLTAGSAAVDAFKSSPACQALDNAAEANRLGLGAVGAP
jgi:hypothetical protein